LHRVNLNDPFGGQNGPFKKKIFKWAAPKASGLKKSDISRMAIGKFLEDFGREEEADLYSKAKRLIGVVESGISDLGQNHREYIINKIKDER
jgi:hypothetical protein